MLMKPLKKIIEFIKKKLANVFEFAKKNSIVAVKATNVLKQVVEGGAASFIVTLTKTDLDNKALAQLKIIVPKVAREMAIAHGIIQAADKNADALAAIIVHVQKLLPDGRTEFWVGFCGRVNFYMADGNLSLAEAIGLGQIVFAEMFPKQK